MMNWINKKRNKKGFTLIELVVVIAILGILAALAIPRLTGSRVNAQRKTILANLRTIDSAITLAQAETGKVALTIAQLVNEEDSNFIGSYLASDPSENKIAEETYGIKSEKNTSDEDVSLGRATVTLADNNVLGSADANKAYTIEELQEIAGWKND